MKDIAFQINDSSKIVQVCSYLGNVFLDNGISDSAFLYFNIGKKVAVKIKDSIQEAYILASLGACYMATKYADSAFLYLTKAATFF